MSASLAAAMCAQRSSSDLSRTPRFAVEEGSQEVVLRGLRQGGHGGGVDDGLLRVVGPSHDALFHALTRSSLL